MVITPHEGPIAGNVRVNGQQNVTRARRLGRDHRKFGRQPCILAYNASVNFVSDTVESALMKFAPSAASIQLANLLTHAAGPVHICGHSQGTLTLFWALRLADRRLDDVTVDFFGPATSSMAYSFALARSGAKPGPYGYCARVNDPVATFIGGNFTGGLALPLLLPAPIRLLGGVDSLASVHEHESSLELSMRRWCASTVGAALLASGLRVAVHRSDQRGARRAGANTGPSPGIASSSTGCRPIRRCVSARGALRSWSRPAERLRPSYNVDYGYGLPEPRIAELDVVMEVRAVDGGRDAGELDGRGVRPLLLGPNEGVPRGALSVQPEVREDDRVRPGRARGRPPGTSSPIRIIARLSHLRRLLPAADLADPRARGLRALLSTTSSCPSKPSTAAAP